MMYILIKIYKRKKKNKMFADCTKSASAGALRPGSNAVLHMS